MPGRRRKSNTILPLVIASIGGILILASVLWLLFPPEGGVSITPDAPAAGALSDDVPRVSLADAKAAFDTGTAVFVDVRGEPYYSQSHIPGALSIPLNELPERLNELDRSAWIITYCT